MGFRFGELPVRIRRILVFSLASSEQKAWIKSVTHGIPNLARRVIYATPTVAPSFIITGLVMKWANSAHERSLRKDPKMYENDE